MPCPFTGCKMFCAGPNFLSQPKHLTAFSASSKTVVPAQKPILLNANHHQKCLRLPQYVNKFLLRHKTFLHLAFVFVPDKKIFVFSKFFFVLAQQFLKRH